MNNSLTTKMNPLPLSVLNQNLLFQISGIAPKTTRTNDIKRLNIKPSNHCSTLFIYTPPSTVVMIVFKISLSSPMIKRREWQIFKSIVCWTWIAASAARFTKIQATSTTTCCLKLQVNFIGVMVMVLVNSATTGVSVSMEKLSLSPSPVILLIRNT